MAAENYVTAIMTVADAQEGFDRLEAALLEIDGQLWAAGVCGAHSENTAFIRQMRSVEVMTMEEADNAPQESVPIGQSTGRTAAEFIYLYPPGIPLLVPGERVPDGLPELLARYQAEGLSVQGMADHSAQTIRCVEG